MLSVFGSLRNFVAFRVASFPIPNMTNEIHKKRKFFRRTIYIHLRRDYLLAPAKNRKRKKRKIIFSRMSKCRQIKWNHFFYIPKYELSRQSYATAMYWICIL